MQSPCLFTHSLCRCTRCISLSLPPPLSLSLSTLPLRRGTAQENVNRDYSLLLEAGRQDAYASVAASFATTTGYKGAPFSMCALSNVTLCPALEAGRPTVVVAYNSLGQAAPSAPVKISVGFPAGVKSYMVSRVPCV